MLDIYQAAAVSLRIREQLRSFDVDHMREERSCLGTAEGLQSDAVRFVLVDRHGEALRCFRAVIDLAQAAVEDRDTWIYDTPEIASFFAWRAAFVAAWALGDNRAAGFGENALDAFAVIAAADDYSTKHPKHPLASTVLLAAHLGRAEQFVKRLPHPSPCRENHPWCRVFALTLGAVGGTPDVNGIEELFQSYVRAPNRFSIVGEDCPMSTAISFAEMRNRVNGMNRAPLEVIGTLLSPAV